MNSDKVLMFSGGLDSACAYHILGKPDCLNCGGPMGPARAAIKGEMDSLNALCELDPEFQKKLIAVWIDWTSFMREGQHTLPRENILAQLAWAKGYNTVLYAWNRNDTNDKERIEHMIMTTQYAVDMDGFKTEFPVWKYYRHELVELALKMGAEPDWLHASWSCVANSEHHCGKCHNCCERYLAFRFAGIPETETFYASSPQKSRVMYDLVWENWMNENWIAHARKAMGEAFVLELKNAKRI